MQELNFNLPYQLQMIDFSTNRIGKIGSKTFRRCKKLEQLFIHTNE